MQSLEFDQLDRIKPPRQARSRRAFLAALDAFDGLLRELPLASVTMDEVARRAGLSITSVYARFDGKAALVLALHERTIATALEQFDGALENPDAVDSTLEEEVGRLIDAVVAFTDEHAHVFRAVLAAADEETNERAAAFIRAGSERIARALAPRLRGDRESLERDIDFAWRSTVAVLQQRWVLWGAEPSRFPLKRDELVDRLTRTFLSVVGAP